MKPQPAAGASVSPTPHHPWHPAAALAADGEFPWRLFFAALVAVVAGHCLFGELRDWSRHLIPGWARPFLALAVLTYGALVLHAERLKSGVMLSAVVLVTSSFLFLGLDAHHLMTVALPSWLSVLLSAVGFSIALSLAYRWRHQLERGRSLERTPAVNYAARCPLRALLLPVSKPDVRPGDNVEILSAGGPCHVCFTGGGKSVEVGGPDIAKAIEDLDVVRPNWQQLLRALRRHLEDGRHLDHVILYGSKDSRLEECASFLRPFLKGLNPKVLPPVDLEDFEQVHALLRAEVETLLQAKLRPEQIAVDITGGFKIPSVAGAVLTLNRAVVCQYVQSVGSEADKKKEIEAQIYDFRWDKSLELPT